MSRSGPASLAATEAVTALFARPLSMAPVVRRLLPQVSRYTIVSALALALDACVLTTLTSGFGLGAAAAGVIGYSLGMVLHFALSQHFVFDMTAIAKSRLRLFGEFAATGVVGLAVTAVILWLATDIAGVPALVAKVAAVGVSFVGVFALRRTIVFSAR